MGSLFKGQFCFPRWTLRREAMPSAQPHSALQPASPLHQPPVGPLLFWQMFVQCLWLGGWNTVSHRSIRQQPEWVRKLPTSPRERFMLVPLDLRPQSAHPPIPYPPRSPSVLISCPTQGPSFALASAESLAAGLSASLGTRRGWYIEDGT